MCNEYCKDLPLIKKCVILLTIFFGPHIVAKSFFFEGVFNNGILGAHYKLTKKPSGKYTMEISPINSSSICHFNVKRMLLPKSTQGKKGIFFSNRPNNCRFSISNNDRENLWNKVVLIDFDYYISGSILKGSASIVTPDRTYPIILDFQKKR